MLEQHITVFDLKRLESYSKNLVDFHLIMDLVPTLAKLHFLILPQGSIQLSYVQAATLAGMGLQFKTIDNLTKDLGLQANQLLPLFNKAIRKFTRLIKEVFEYDIAQEMNRTEQQAQNMLKNVSANKEAASKLGTKSLNAELEDKAAGLGTKMASQMQSDKEKFIAKHKIKKSQADAIEGVKLGEGQTRVSIPRKRSGEEDDEEGNALSTLERKVRSKKGDGKGFSNKRQRTK